jgi:hypothetical protein
MMTLKTSSFHGQRIYDLERKQNPASVIQSIAGVSLSVYHLSTPQRCLDPSAGMTREVWSPAVMQRKETFRELTQLGDLHDSHRPSQSASPRKLIFHFWHLKAFGTNERQRN